MANIPNLLLLSYIYLHQNTTNTIETSANTAAKYMGKVLILPKYIAKVYIYHRDPPKTELKYDDDHTNTFPITDKAYDNPVRFQNISLRPSVFIDDPIPEILVNNMWLPICGRGFRENNYGASLFCQKLDSKYKYGLITRIFNWYANIYSLDSGIRIGKCLKHDKDLFSCTGSVGLFPIHQKCDLTKEGTVYVKCFE